MTTDQDIHDALYPKEEVKRKIIQIHVLDFKMGDYSVGYTVALCNDGTLWKHIDPGKDSDEPDEWYKLKDIPQPGDKK